MQELIRQETACFSGHRPPRLPWGFNESDMRCAVLRDKITGSIEAAAAQGFRHFLCGGALGVDILCGEAVLDMRERRGEVTLEVVVPCAGQDKSWPYAARERYSALLETADRVLVLNKTYTPSCMMERNRNMISRSGLLIAVFDGQRSGGTWQTLKMAIHDKIELDIIVP